MAITSLFSRPCLVTLKNRLFPPGVTFDDNSRKRALLNGITLIGIFFLILLGSVASIQGGILLATIDFLVAALLAGLFSLLWIKGWLDLCIKCSLTLMFLLFLYLFIDGGIAGNAYLWSFTFPLLAFFLLGTKKGALVSSIYYFSCLVVILLDLNTAIAIDLYNKDFALRFLPSFAVVILLAFSYELFREKSQKALIELNDRLEHEVAKRTMELQQEVKEKSIAQKEAINAKKEWERTFDAVPDEIVILDAKHKIIRANKAMADALDIPIAKLINTQCYNSIQGEKSPPPECPHSKLLEDHTVHQLDFFDDFTQRHLSVTISPLHDAHGEFFGSVRVARDITVQKNAEIERNTAKEQLRKAEKMEAIGLMAGGVAHDLNNILSGVVGYPEMLLLQLSEDDEFYPHLKIIHDSGRRAAAVVEDLLTVARGVATVRKVSSLNEIISEYLDSTELRNIQSLHPQVNITLDLKASLWNINCSPVHIQKLLMNLVNNGIEAIDADGDVIISTSNKIINEDDVILSLQSGEYVVLSIRDTGQGISEYDLEKIFEPFYTKKIMGRSGTGLGLAVVWNIIMDHEAAIDVNSCEDGTTFTIYFPASSEEKTLPETDTDIAALHGSGNVLIVDDEQKMREIAARMLEYLGYSTTSVASGEVAVAFLKNNSVDLVLLDMLMEPGMNGRQTYEKIIAISPGQKAIIASGFSESDDVKATLKLGAGSFIKKPYTMAQLGKAMKAGLSTELK